MWEGQGVWLQPCIGINTRYGVREGGIGPSYLDLPSWIQAILESWKWNIRPTCTMNGHGLYRMVKLTIESFPDHLPC